MGGCICFACVYVCVVCSYVCVCVRVCMSSRSMDMWASSYSIQKLMSCLSQFLFSVFVSSWTGSSLVELVWPRICYQALGLQVNNHAHFAFMWILEIWILCLTLVQQALHSSNHLSSLRRLYWFLLVLLWGHKSNLEVGFILARGLRG